MKVAGNLAVFLMGLSVGLCESSAQVNSMSSDGNYARQSNTKIVTDPTNGRVYKQEVLEVQVPTKQWYQK